MRIDYLQEFIVAADTLNFSAAAKKLHIAQPTLSTHMRAIECELGVELFSRDKHRLRLSKIGQTFYRETLDVVKQYNHALESVQHLLDSLSSELLVGYLYNAFKKIIPKTVSDFKNSFPSIDPQLTSYGYSDITRALCRGDIDMAFTLDVDSSLHESCNVLVLGEDKLGCVVRKDDPLSSCECISIQDLRHEALLLPHPSENAGMALFYDEIFRTAGFKPTAAMYYKDIDTRYLDIESGSGIGIVGSHFQSAMSDRVKFIPIVEEYCKYPFAIMWRKTNHNLSIQNFVETARKTLEDISL